MRIDFELFGLDAQWPQSRWLSSVISGSQGVWAAYLGHASLSAAVHVGTYPADRQPGLEGIDQASEFALTVTNGLINRFVAQIAVDPSRHELVSDLSAFASNETARVTEWGTATWHLEPSVEQPGSYAARVTGLGSWCSGFAHIQESWVVVHGYNVAGLDGLRLKKLSSYEEYGFDAADVRIPDAQIPSPGTETLPFTRAEITAMLSGRGRSQ